MEPVLRAVVHKQRKKILSYARMRANREKKRKSVSRGMQNRRSCFSANRGRWNSCIYKTGERISCGFERKINRPQKLQIVVSAYASSLCNPSFSNDEENDRRCVEDTCGHLQKTFSTTSFNGLSHGRLVSVMISGEASVNEVSKMFEQVKTFIWIERMFAFVRVSENFGEIVSGLLHNGKAYLACDHDYT